MACTPTQSTSAHVESGLLRAAVSATFEVDCPACFGRVKPAVMQLAGCPFAIESSSGLGTP